MRVTTEAMGWESDAWPNGVVGTPDGKKLYVNKWYYDNKGGTWVFDINPDGTLSNMQKFTEWGGDGMSMDEGVMAFDPSGTNILRKILFITGPVDKVTAVKMNVKGAANW